METRGLRLRPHEREKLVALGAIVAELHDQMRFLYHYVKADGTVCAREVLKAGKKQLEFC
ncbi:MAG: hypothetical protein WA021_02395 [Minisyncoccia bacterium]